MMSFFQYVLLTLLSAGNCWDITDIKNKKKTKSILSFNFKPPASILFIVPIKDCGKSSLLIKCSPKATRLSYYPLNTENLCSLYSADWLIERVHNKLKQQNDPQSLGLPHIFNWSLVSVCQHVLCVVFVVCYIFPLLWSPWQPQCSLRPWLHSPLV